MNHIATSFNGYNHIFLFHAFVLIGGLLTFPFASVLLAWFYWLYKGGRRNRELSEQACRALNFQFLIQSIAFLSGIIMCTHSINAMANGNAFDYTWLTCQLFLIIPAYILYPSFILIYIGITRKYHRFYPKTIRLFND